MTIDLTSQQEKMNMNSRFSLIRHTVTAALVAVCLLLAPTVFAQVQPYTNTGFYGTTQFKVNGELVASRFNYQIFSQPNTGGGFANFTNFSDGCYMSLAAGVRILPFNVNATVKVLDTSTSANTETVALSAITTNAAPLCVLSLSTSNTHTGGYVLSSGTCGLAEALNFLGQGVTGVIAVTQEFYDQGCTTATITGTTVAGIITNNQQIHDWTTGLWWSLQPSTLSTISAPTVSANATCTTTAGLVCQQATTGGTWPNSAEHVAEFYVDCMGGWSAASTDHSFTPSASGTNILQFNSPAAATGACGWLPAAGLAYNSTTYVLPPTTGNTLCTLSTTFTQYPVCKMGANATVLGPLTTTSLIPQYGGVANGNNPNPQAHTTFAMRPSRRAQYGFQLNYGPFTACPALTAGQQCILGTVQLPTGFLTTLGIGGTMRFSGDVTLTPSTGGTIGINVQIGDITDFTTGAPKTVCTLGETTATGTAAIKVHFDCSWTVNALTTAGSIMPGGFFLEQLQAGTTTGNIGVEQATGAITADVLDQDAVFFTFLQASAAESTTPPQLMNLKFEILDN